MTRNGFAWHFKKYQREQTREDRSLYAGFEDLARQFELGIWADKKPLEPWEYRKGTNGKPVSTIVDKPVQSVLTGIAS